MKHKSAEEARKAVEEAKNAERNRIDAERAGDISNLKLLKICVDTYKRKMFNLIQESNSFLDADSLQQSHDSSKKEALEKV